MSDIEVIASGPGEAQVACPGCMTVLLQIHGMSVDRLLDELQYVNHDCPADKPDPLDEPVRLPDGRTVTMREVVQYLPSEKDIRQ